MITHSSLTTPIVIAIDLGSSLFKIVYTGRTGRPEAMAITPQLVSGISADRIAAHMAEYGDDPLRSAWVKIDGKSYAAGHFAIDLKGRQYHEASKWQNLIPRILIILGLVASRLELPHSFPAQIALLLPRDEVNHPQREAHLAEIMQQAQQFTFRGQTIECQLQTKIASEGAGLFTAHAAALEREGINPKTIDIPVVMAGERNTSLLLYRVGKINPTLSSSDGPGFYQFVEPLKKAIGVPVQLPDLIQNVAMQKYCFRVSGGDIVDISQHVPAALDAYGNAVEAYLKAKLPPGNVNLIAGGGAFSLIWSRLESCFEQLSIPAVYVGTDLMEELVQMLALRPLEFDLTAHPALPVRFADAFGIYKAIAARQRQELAQPLTLIR